MSMLVYDIFETAYGWVGVVASENGIKRITLPELAAAEAESELRQAIQGGQRDSLCFEELRSRLDRYFSGEPEDLTGIAIDLDDPEFFTRARPACRSIPAGETRTYAWIAEAAGSPNAIRAAGLSMARQASSVAGPVSSHCRKQWTVAWFRGKDWSPTQGAVTVVGRPPGDA